MSFASYSDSIPSPVLRALEISSPDYSAEILRDGSSEYLRHAYHWHSPAVDDADVSISTTHINTIAYEMRTLAKICARSAVLLNGPDKSLDAVRNAYMRIFEGVKNVRDGIIMLVPDVDTTWLDTFPPAKIPGLFHSQEIPFDSPTHSRLSFVKDESRTPTALYPLGSQRTHVSEQLSVTDQESQSPAHIFGSPSTHPMHCTCVLRKYTNTNQPCRPLSPHTPPMPPSTFTPVPTSCEHEISIVGGVPTSCPHEVSLRSFHKLSPSL
ncbi:hypothetical protein A0H81_13936 [Grifola frondosa]|uniref:Uncharacterized protein n=1 Tax=Grifola frondosa TaxID=5627 RepID=A0A1C7LMY0_GRIFR|nr:hypothetical protein A0H81_13936 [Grifola frondosa]